MVGNIKLRILVMFLFSLFWSSTTVAITTLTEYYVEDLEQIVKKKILRVLVVYDGVNYYFVDGHQEGLSVALMNRFKKYIDENYLLNSKIKLDIQYIPVPEDQIYDMLIKGVGDVAANFFVPRKKKIEHISYTKPLMDGVTEVLVTNKDFPKIKNLKQLSGMTVYVKKSSKTIDTLKSINVFFDNMHMKRINIVKVDKVLLDYELVEGVQNGRFPAVVLNSAKSHIWQWIFNSVVFHYEYPLTQDDTINWAVHSNNQHLLASLNEFIGKYNSKTDKGSKLIAYYLYPQASTTSQHDKSHNVSTMGLKFSDFERYKSLFKKYGEKYDLDWRLLLCQAYQESSLKQSAKSNRGAVGILQVSPSLVKHFHNGENSFDSLEGNIQVGTMYLRYIIDNYFSDFYLDSYNQVAFALAAYNAGPGRIASFRKEAEKRNLDSNVWFGNVEKIVAEKGFNETITYVSNILKRYQAYLNSSKSTKSNKQ